MLFGARGPGAATRPACRPWRSSTTSPRASPVWTAPTCTWSRAGRAAGAAAGLGLAGTWLTPRAPFFTRRWIDAALAGAPDERVDDLARVRLLRRLSPAAARRTMGHDASAAAASARLLAALRGAARVRQGWWPPPTACAGRRAPGSDACLAAAPGSGDGPLQHAPASRCTTRRSVCSGAPTTASTPTATAAATGFVAPRAPTCAPCCSRSARWSAASPAPTACAACWKTTTPGATTPTPWACCWAWSCGAASSPTATARPARSWAL